MKIIAIFASILLLAMAGRSIGGVPQNEDLAVLKAATAGSCNSIPGKYVVLSASTFPVAPVDVTGDLDKTASSNLLLRNSVPSKLPHVAELECNGIKVALDSRIETLLKDRPTMIGLSKGFEEAFPDSIGIMSLSLPGYSANKQDALVHMDLSCGATCGNSQIIHLHKKDGAWVRVRSSNSWLS